MACWCEWPGSVARTPTPTPTSTSPIRANLRLTLPCQYQFQFQSQSQSRGIICGSARRASSRKNTTESTSLLMKNSNNTFSNTVERTSEEEEYVVPKLPGDEPDFWEGPQWDTVGFIMQYLWAFGIVFAVVACGVAVRTYNYGATDFKETPVYKEAIESQGLFEEAPETLNPQVFETNPSEIAPSP